MRLYLDDDSISASLIRNLRDAGHDVHASSGDGLEGADDSIHLRHSILDRRALLTRNHDDFWNLHQLVLQSGGHHPGVLVVRRDNNPRRDMTDRGIATAMKNLENAGLTLADEFVILNHWR